MPGGRHRRLGKVAATVSAAAANDAKVIINIEAVNISTGTLETYSIRK